MHTQTQQKLAKALKVATMMSSRHNLRLIVLIIVATSAACAVDLPVDFTLPLDVGTLDQNSYMKFMKTLHQKLESLKGATQIKGVPVLAPQPDPNQDPNRWFHLELEANNKKTTVRFRGDNLYIVGYQMQNKKTWLEYTREKRYIPGSEDLKFGDTYKQMGDAAKEKVTQISLTKKAFIEAVEDLAVSTVKEKRAKALMLVAQMVCEACRLNDMSAYFTTNLDKSKAVLETWMMGDLVWKWGDYSTDVLCYNKYPKEYKYKPKKINGQKIKTVDELRARLGAILLTSKFVKVKCDLKKYKLMNASLYLQSVVGDVAELSGTTTNLFWLLLFVILCIVSAILLVVRGARNNGPSSKAKKA